MRNAGRADPAMPAEDDPPLWPAGEDSRLLANGSVRLTQEKESLVQQFAIASSVRTAAGLATFYQVPFSQADPF